MEHGVAVVSLGRILEDAEKLVSRQAEEPPRFSVEFRPDLCVRHDNNLVLFRQRIGPLVDGCCHWVCLAVLGIRIAREEGVSGE